MTIRVRADFEHLGWDGLVMIPHEIIPDEVQLNEQVEMFDEEKGIERWGEMIGFDLNYGYFKIETEEKNDDAEE